MSLTPYYEVLAVFELLEVAIEEALKAGAQFAIARYDESRRTLIEFERERVVSVQQPSISGIGIVAYVGGFKGYGFTPELTRDAVREAARKAVKMARLSATLAKQKLSVAEYKPEEYKGFVPPMRRDPAKVELSEKVSRVRDAIGDALARWKELVSLRVTYVDLRGKKLILTSDGIKREWEPYLVGLAAYAVVRVNGNIGSSHELFGASRGFELLDEVKMARPEELIDRAIRGAKDMAVARRLTPGRYALVCDPRFAGVIAHESFGHLTEADYVLNRISILHGRLGERIGSEHVTICDSGDPVNFGWFQPYDDDGCACKTAVLCERGVLKQFLTTRDTAPLLGVELTGNARAIDFAHPPVPRMRNTYFGAGDFSSREELFELIKRGVYVEGSLGGQVEPTGTFTFGANRAYWVENGEIKHPLKAVNVRAHILEFLRNVIGATRDVLVEGPVLGGCGKRGQSPLPVGLGGPYLAVREAIVGG